MEQVLRLVSQLVRDFQGQERAYLSPTYQESQVRQDFIDKFFTALGWDVTHEKQKNPYEQEVKIENRVRTESSQRFADYAFFIAPNYRDVKYFVEAKKPAKDLSNPEYYYQTIRYGWNQSTPIAVLTDFEEFHIIDCRYKPNIKTALERKIESFHFTQYEDEVVFKKIFYLFGREAVINGSIEKYAATLAKPRGKKAEKGVLKSGYQQVDQAFLELLDGYRDQLAHAFKNKNQQLNGEELTEAVQRTIDRLVFIRFLEDKGIEEKTVIGFKSKQSSWNSFLGLCKSLEPKYNGLVFKEHPIIDNSTFNAPDEKVFSEICSELADPSSPYDFNSIPISILGNIYERFLGKVVTTTDKRAKIVEKPEVRKAGGVYYTPEYIVRYIVGETVGKLIDGKTPDEIRKMAFADIACGSGSFLIEVYDKLLEYHTKYYTEHPEKAKKGDIEKRAGAIALSHKKRQEILVNNIYGVDIDFQATEVTQLSLYLKLMEDVTMNDAYQFSLLKERMLPDLRRNIVCGNSLIGRDILDGKLFDDETEHTLKPMNFEDVFPEVMKRGGFDAVVGNPPYVRQESLGDRFIYYAKDSYHSYTNQADLYVFFIEKSINILKSGGIYGIICSNKFMRSNYGKEIRKFLVSNTALQEVIDFGELPVFQNAATFPVIMILKKQIVQNQKFVFAPMKSLIFNSLEEEVNKSALILDSRSVSGDNWRLSSNEASEILDKLVLQGIPLGKYVENKIYFGIKTGLDQAFVIDQATKNNLIKQDYNSSDLIRSYVIGDAVRKYTIIDKQKYLIFIPQGWTRSHFGLVQNLWNLFTKKYPAIANHLLQYEKKAKERTDQGDYWWELRSCDYYKEFDKPKIVYPDIAKESRFTFDDNGMYMAATTFTIPKDDLFLLGILNSKLIFYYLSHVCPVLGDVKRGGRLRLKTVYMKTLPIRTINSDDPADKDRHDNIVGLVEQILSAKAKHAKANTEAEKNRLEIQIEALDRQIDNAVYELYGLTEEEIKIVEGNN